ncbi:MAG TPA: tetratricopeptide repeat protein [Polyangia bacterium]|nr:tetratricopeptide repeat protein [Polyangia bacterium]
MADDRPAEQAAQLRQPDQAHVVALVTRGRAHYAAGEHPEALACLTEALREGAAYADVFQMVGVMVHQQGRLTDAEEMFRQALRLNPSYTEAALNLVVTLNDLGKYAEAQSIYAQVMQAVKHAPRELDPFVRGKIANMHAELGATYRAVGAHEDAVREYRRALALCPTFGDVRTALAKTLQEAGDLPAAIRELEAVKTEQPGFVPALLHLGLAYQAAGRTPDAVQQWRDVLQVDPANRTAKMYLAMHAAPAAGRPATG